MKTMKKYILGLCVGALFTLSGCYDLDQLPNDQVAVDFNNTTQAEQVLVGVYAGLNESQLYQGRWSFDNCSDIAWCTNGWWDSYDHYAISHGNLQVWLGTIRDKWKKYYLVIQRANRFIANMQSQGADGTERAHQMIGEAKFLRALMYHEMLQFWGGVPLYTEENVFEEATLGRSTAEETRAQIISDLEYAIANCADNAPGTNVGQASKGAAYALLGKVYLYNKQYQEAINAFNEVLSRGYQLEPNFRNLFRPAGAGLTPDGADNGKEMIFAVEHSKDMANRYGFNTQFLTLRSSRGGGINVTRALPSFVYSFKAKDGKTFEEKAAEILGPEANALRTSSDLADRVKFWGSQAIGYREGDKSKTLEDGSVVTVDKDGNVIDKFEINRIKNAGTEYIFDGYTPYKDKIRQLWAAMDPRLGYTVILPYEWYDGYGTTNYDEYLKDNTVTPVLGTVPVESVVYGYVASDGSCETTAHGNTNLHLLIQEYGQSSYVWRKFLEEGDWNGTNPDRNANPVNWPIIRYADVLLMLAEAYIGIGDAGKATQYVKQVRDRVGMPTPSTVTLADIQAERSYELALEGHRFFDLRRWGIYVQRCNGLVEADVFGVPRSANPARSLQAFNDELWPIDGWEMGLNPNLEQNPAWK